MQVLHTFKDRLRAVECPMDMIAYIGGWRSVGGVGVRYGVGVWVEATKGLVDRLFDVTLLAKITNACNSKILILFIVFQQIRVSNA